MREIYKAMVVGKENYHLHIVPEGCFNCKCKCQHSNGDLLEYDPGGRFYKKGDVVYYQKRDGRLMQASKALYNAYIARRRFNNNLQLIKDITGASEIINIEDLTEQEKNYLAKILDVDSGIDYLLRTPKGQYGIAARVQGIIKGKNPYNTFTIRSKLPSGKPTELQKREEAIINKSFYPHVTMQMYVDEEEEKCISLGIIPTLNLYKLKKEYPSLFKTPSFFGNQRQEWIMVHWDSIPRDYNVVQIFGDFYARGNYDFFDLYTGVEPHYQVARDAFDQHGQARLWV